MTTPHYQLITIPLSHYCEKARWALERLNIPFEESAHAPVLHLYSAKKNGGKGTLPILKAGDRTIADSTEILQFLDAQAPTAKKLYPSNKKDLDEVVALEALFNSQLGPSLRKWVYFPILCSPETQVLKKFFLKRVPKFEQFLFPLFFKPIRALMLKSMGINKESSLRARERVLNVFQQTDAMLLDGRPYLVGSRFSAADLTFASLAAPVIFPQNYGGILPEFSELPNSFQQEVEVLRKTPSGQHILKMFEVERPNTTGGTLDVKI